MHPKDDLLLAYRDNQLPENQVEQVREHLAGCPACQQRLEEFSNRAVLVQARLDAMSPGPFEQARSPQAAYRSFTNTNRLKLQQKENQSMFRKRTLWITVSIFALLAIVFTLTPANALASSFLSLFRVQKVQVVTFDPSAVDTARGKVEANRAAIEQIFKDDVKITENGKAVEVPSVAEAAQKAGFTPRMPDLQNPVIKVQPHMNAVFTIHQPKLQALMDAVGLNAKLPASVDGKVVTVDVANAVSVSTGCKTTEGASPKENIYIASTCTSFVQMPSPVINTPDGLNLPELGQAVFQFMGLPADQAAQLSQKIDWTSTLVLPIPTDSKISYKDVQVDGVSGTLLEGTGEGGSALVWVKDGMLYGLHVPGSGDDALKVAGTLK